MNTSTFEFLSILKAQKETDEGAQKNGYDYMSVLDHVRSAIASNHASDLAAVLDDAQSATTLKALIMKYAAEYMAGQDYDRDSLVDRIYQDMASLGILTKHLYDPTVEEININGYNTIEIIYSNRTEFLRGQDAFPSPQAALDLVKRMVRMGGMLLDAQTPHVDSFIGSGTRISAIIPPLVPQEYGVVVSIRKQIKNRITHDQLISTGSATADMLDFLSLCLCYGVSIGIAGGTSSGKTTLAAYLLNDYILKNDDYNSRVFIIEDSRELFLTEYDDDHDRPARVLYTKTKGQPNPVSMQDLIVDSLRFDPTLIVPAEVRDGAAFQAAEAGNTGHTILTSFHADGAGDGYNRLVSMCHMSGTTLTNDELFERCIKAWPIMVFQKQLKDNTRKIMEIFEAHGYVDGKIQGEMLYRFIVEDVERNEFGRITKVHGEHKRTGCISPHLYQRLRDNGASEDFLFALFPEAIGEDHLHLIGSQSHNIYPEEAGEHLV